MKIPCKICRKEFGLQKSPGINPDTGKEFKIVCGKCWGENGGIVGEILEVER